MSLNCGATSLGRFLGLFLSAKPDSSSCLLSTRRWLVRDGTQMLIRQMQRVVNVTLWQKTLHHPWLSHLFQLKLLGLNLHRAVQELLGDFGHEALR